MRNSIFKNYKLLALEKKTCNLKMTFEFIMHFTKWKITFWLNLRLKRVCLFIMKKIFILSSLINLLNERDKATQLVSCVSLKIIHTYHPWLYLTDTWTLQDWLVIKTICLLILPWCKKKVVELNTEAIFPYHFSVWYLICTFKMPSCFLLQV